MLTHAIFDVDNTLYSPNSGVMQTIRHRINVYMTEHLGFSAEEASTLRSYYWEKYGTTLRGLMIEHSVEPSEYLEFVHDFPVSQCLKPDPILDKVLSSVPMEKVVFTSSTIAHARRVLEALQINQHFTSIFDIESVDFICKPNLFSYRKVLNILRVEGANCLMVEDSPPNLVAASRLNMVTVYVGPEQTDFEADFSIESVSKIDQIVPILSTRGCIPA